MASVDHLLFDAEKIIAQIIQKNIEFEPERSRIYNAVVIIQRSWRGFVIRKELRRLHKAATVIQRHVRGFLARINIPNFMVKFVQSIYNEFYSKMATIIQAAWRGYWYRKKILNFHENYMMLKNVEKANEELVKRIQKAVLNQENIRRRKREEEAKRMVLYIVFKLHHFLRTHQIEGIYSIHNQNTLSKVEELLSSAKFTGYMQALRKKYNETCADVKPIVKIPKTVPQLPSLEHSKPFSFDPRIERKYDPGLMTAGKFERKISNIQRKTEWNKHMHWRYFDITAKKVPPKFDVPPYFIDFWARGCSGHDLTQED